MTTRPRRLLAGLMTALCVVAGCSGDDGAAPSSTLGDPTVEATDDGLPPVDTTAYTLSVDGLGPVRLGMSESDAVATGLVGEFQAGCRLEGGAATSALFVEPVVGTVYAQDGAVTGILVVGGPVATDPGGVAVNTPRQDAADALGDAGLSFEVDESTAATFGVHFWSATQDGTQVLGGTIDPATSAVAAIAAPRVLTCE